jgi:hypothetical protein
LLKTFLRRLLLYVFPGGLIFVSNDKFAVNFSSDTEKNVLIKFVLFIVGFVVINLIVPIINEKDKKKVSQLSESLSKMLGEVRKMVSIELEKIFITQQLREVGVDDLKLNIRIFVPKRRTFRELINKELYFQYKNYDNLHVREIDELKLQVKPSSKIQGLVGMSYDKKTVKFDFKLFENQDEYNLTERQKDIVGYCNFAIAAPIFKKDGQKIIAIVCFDSEVEIPQPAGQKWRDIVKTYCKIIHKNHALITSN